MKRNLLVHIRWSSSFGNRWSSRFGNRHVIIHACATTVAFRSGVYFFHSRLWQVNRLYKTDRSHKINGAYTRQHPTPLLKL